MDAPEVRLSPDGNVVAIRNYFGHPSGSVRWHASNGDSPTDEAVSDWTPLLPVSNEDGDS